MGHATFRVGDLEAVISDNEACGEHQAGYNGLWSLRHATGTRSLFVPGFAGLHLYHLFDGEADDYSPEVRYEPRRSPMTFRQLSDTEAELHQPPTPLFCLESWVRFTFVAPHSLDLCYRCIAHEPAFRRGYIGVSWTSYIHAPEDKSLYFVGYPAAKNRYLQSPPPGGRESGWCQLCTLHHHDINTIRHWDDELELAGRAYTQGSASHKLSPIRFDLPLCYGLFEEHVWLLMFEPTTRLRFGHNPYGGSGDAERRTTNPAWSFQFLVPDYELGKEHGFRARAVFRPRCSREEILEEYQRWILTLQEGRDLK